MLASSLLRAPRGCACVDPLRSRLAEESERRNDRAHGAFLSSFLVSEHCYVTSFLIVLSGSFACPTHIGLHIHRSDGACPGRIICVEEGHDWHRATVGTARFSSSPADVPGLGSQSEQAQRSESGRRALAVCAVKVKKTRKRNPSESVGIRRKGQNDLRHTA